MNFPTVANSWRVHAGPINIRLGFHLLGRAEYHLPPWPCVASVIKGADFYERWVFLVFVPVDLKRG